MPILPILISFLPTLIKGAESLFPKKEGEPSRGGEKKAFVLSMVGKAFDMLHVEKILPDFPNVDEKAYFLDIVSVSIEHLLPQLK